jgi:hypothetical protein
MQYLHRVETVDWEIELINERISVRARQYVGKNDQRGLQLSLLVNGRCLLVGFYLHQMTVRNGRFAITK